ncbi:hypothetical protein [Paenibacillus lupini]|uniref:hypothetical protein n=1 Tax=Paenibacillus lupini TaxID=1450204 RepID=UPI0014222220|nr:hypothetical protein [Paenibacillus lupini]NIK23723.1 hypothetical protein [Paenibacillus lupini]
MSRVLKITGIVFLILLAAAGLIVWQYDFPKKINLTYPAVEFRAGDPSSVDKTTVTIKGTLHRKLFHEERKFTGQIEITKYEATKERMDPIIFSKVINNGGGFLNYIGADYKPNGATKRLYTIGMGSIWKVGEFESMKLLLFEPVGESEGATKDLKIMAPATDYESALALDRQYKERNQD